MKRLTIQDIITATGIIRQPCIVVGGAALPFYGVELWTTDIDIEIINTCHHIEIINDALHHHGILGDVTNNVSNWGIIPLPDKYRDRIIKTDIHQLYVLHPLDFICSKLRRGMAKDIKASIQVCSTQQISVSDITKHVKLIKLPFDPESRLFLDRMNVFFNKLEATCMAQYMPEPYMKT